MVVVAGGGGRGHAGTRGVLEFVFLNAMPSADVRSLPTVIHTPPLRKQRKGLMAAFLSCFLADRRATPPFLNPGPLTGNGVN